MTIGLDRILGRAPMHLLVVACLGTLSLLALVLAFARVLAVDPWALLASAGVLTASSWIANEVLARIVGTRAHTASWVVTAQLLLFVLQPTLEIAGLVGLALAAVVAAASKYLLAWRGRHLVNPAAAGALAVGLAGLAFPSWWVGTGPLLPVVAIGALLVLLRTRHLGMGLVYVAVGVAVTTTQAVLAGAPPASALALATLSTPLVFTAGFMLNEPLTLPPRRRQRLVLGVVVALLATVPFSLGPVGTSPELALVLGGALAFLLGQRRAVRLELVGRRALTPTAWELRFRPDAPVRFAPGQYLELDLPHPRPDARGTRRVFSIASAPGEPELAIGVRTRTAERLSTFKRALLELEPGARLRATGVWGDFTLPRRPDARIALVAAGIGVTPFIAQLGALAAAGRAADVELLYAVGSAEEIAYREELAAAGCRVSLVCPDDPGELPPGWSWLGPGGLDADAVHRAIPDAAERVVHLSGAPADVARLRAALRRSGVRRIRTDLFLGY